MGIGRRPKVAALRRLHGSRTRPHHKIQPEPVRGRPIKPGYLSEVASAAWDDLAATLDGEGRLTISDAGWLLDTALAFEALQRARIESAANPMTYVKCWVDSSGQEHQEPKVHPATTQLRYWIDTYRRALAEGGLTPTARARVSMGHEAKETDPVDAFLKRA